jgi:hypothetical protein
LLPILETIKAEINSLCRDGTDNRSSQMYEYIAKELSKDLSNTHSFISPEPILTKNSTSPVQQFVKDLTRISGNFKTSRHVIDIISIANYDT